MVSVPRLYTGDDGESHFEDVELAEAPLQTLSWTAPAGLVGPLAGCDVYLLRMSGEGGDDGWHNAPRRQWAIQLIGVSEIEAGSGEIRRFGPGSLIFAEDTTGRGHNSRSVGRGENLMLFVGVPDDWVFGSPYEGSLAPRLTI